MGSLRLRFTLRSHIIAVMIIAGLLAIPAGWQVITAVISLPSLALIISWWLSLRGHRRLAAFCFWPTAVIANVAIAYYCVFPDGWFYFLIWGLSLFVILPTLLAFGVAWAFLATREAVTSRRPPSVAWLSVVALAVMPAATSWSLWPFRMNFLTARPGLELLAKRVAAGQLVSYPQWAGQFRLAGSAIDPSTGDVALLIVTDPNGPAGFVRDMGRRSSPYGCIGPIRGDVLHVELGGGWCYHVED